MWLQNKTVVGGMWGEREVVWSLLTIYFSQLWRKIIICLPPVSTTHCCSVFITVGFITLGPKVIFSFKNKNKHFPGPLSVNLVFYTTPLPVNRCFCLLSSFLAFFLTPHSVSAHHLWRRTRSVGGKWKTVFVWVALWYLWERAIMSVHLPIDPERKHSP